MIDSILEWRISLMRLLMVAAEKELRGLVNSRSQEQVFFMERRKGL